MPKVKLVDKLPDTKREEQGFEFTGLKLQFTQLLDTTIHALQLANNNQAPVYIRLTTMAQATEINDSNEVIVFYVPGTGQIWMANLNGSPPEALASLYIQAKINLAMNMEQEARQQKEKAEIPEYLRKYSEVFEKKAAECFPEFQSYDHAIDLRPDFMPRDCKVYLLSLKEEKKLNKFIDKNLRKRYIHASKLSQALPFFFVGKKDGNLWPCQDYWYLNEGTVKNTYPPPSSLN